MVCATVLNSVRQSRAQKIWRIDDFMGDSQSVEAQLEMQSADEMMRIAMQYFPPPIQ